MLVVALSKQRQGSEGRRSAIALALFAFAYLAAASVSLWLARSGAEVAGIWLPNAIAVAYILRVTPANPLPVLLAMLPASAAANALFGSPVANVILFSVMNSAQVWLAIRLLGRRRRDGWSDEKRFTLSRYIRLFVCAGLLAPLACGIVVGAALLWTNGTLVRETARLWWSGEAFGCAVVLPLLMLMPRRVSLRKLEPLVTVKFAASALACAALAPLALIFAHYPLVFMVVPLMIAAAYWRPFEMSLIIGLTALTSIAVGINDMVTAVGQGPEVFLNGLQTAVALSMLLALAGSLLLEQIRRERSRIAESEERFRRAMEDSAIGMAIGSLDGTISNVNRSLAQMLGYSQAELVGKTFEDISCPEDIEIGRLAVGDAIRTRQPSYRFEKRYCRKDGSIVWGRVAGSIIRDADTGEAMYFVSQIEDIDVERRSRAEVMEAETRWNFALASAGQGVWDLDLRKGGTYYSPTWKRLLGYGDEELGNDPNLWMALMHPEDRANARHKDIEHMHGGTPYFEAEFRMRHKQGHWVWILDRGKVLERDGDGAAMRMIGTHTDISRQKEIEQSLRATAAALADEKERLRVTLHSIGDAVICTDSENRISFMNPVAEKLTGIALEEAQGRLIEAVYALIDEETGKQIQSGPEARLGRKGREDGARAVLVRPDGTRSAIREVVAPILTERSEFAGYVIVFQDFTDARTLQRELAYAASHDALTGLVNRRSFSRTLASLAADSATSQSQHQVLFIDLDRFKNVNDSAGHAAGDALLNKVAITIKARVRQHDIASRFGGDEFAVILRNCSAEGGEIIARALVKAIRDLDFEWQGERHAIGASIGMTSLRLDSGDSDDIVAEADRACYAAKAAGRGQVVVHAAPQRLPSVRRKPSAKAG